MREAVFLDIGGKTKIFYLLKRKTIGFLGVVCVKAKKNELAPFGFDWPRRRRLDLFPAIWDEDFPVRFPSFRSMMGEPAIDVFERGSEVVVTAELPGTRKEDISIKVLDDGMNLQVQQKERKEEKQEDKRRGFYSFSSSSRFEGYSRFIPFRSQVNAKAAKATYKNGVLEVRLPKSGKGGGHEVKVE